MTNFYFRTTFFLFISTLIVCHAADYYWRDYYLGGSIPSDAIPVSKNFNGVPTYIGQGYVDDVGIVPIAVSEGDKEIKVSLPYNIESDTQFMKILCGPKENFAWISTNSSYFHVNTENKLVIPGGFLETCSSSEYVSIGRARYMTQDGIGTVYSCTEGDFKLYFVDRVTGQSFNQVDFYEVLVYNENSE